MNIIYYAYSHLINMNSEICLFAAHAHRTQRRKNADADPYINHPVEVAMLVDNFTHASKDAVNAALLHDVVEDCGITAEKISSRFGPIITKIVLECTDDKSLPKVDRKRAQIEHMSSDTMSFDGKMVKLADKYSNLSTLLTDPPTKWSTEFIVGTVYWSYAVCKPVLDSECRLAYMMINLFIELSKELNITLDITDEELEQKLESYYKLCVE